MSNHLMQAAANNLISLILDYESDTFSASGSKINRTEALAVVALLIANIEDHLDGITLSALLDEVREL